jgi:hypothetical protein
MVADPRLGLTGSPVTRCGKPWSFIVLGHGQLIRHPLCDSELPEVSNMVAGIATLLVGVVGILFVRKRGARKRSTVVAR